MDIHYEQTYKNTLKLADDAYRTFEKGLGAHYTKTLAIARNEVPHSAYVQVTKTFTWTFFWVPVREHKTIIEANSKAS